MTTTATRTLREDQYEILRLIKHEGFSVPEIADELGITFEAARGRVRTLRDRGLLRTFSGRGRRPVVTVDLRSVRPRAS